MTLAVAVDMPTLPVAESTYMDGRVEVAEEESATPPFTANFWEADGVKVMSPVSPNNARVD